MLLALLIGVGVIWAMDGPQRVKNKIDDVTNSIEHATKLPGAAPTGLDAGSLVLAANFRQALTQIPNGRLVSLRLAPDRLNVNVAQGSTLHVAQVSSDGRTSDTAVPGPARQPRLIVDATAPARMARAAVKLGHPLDTVSYLVLLREGERQVWLLYFDDGTHVQANAHGRRVKRF